MIWKILEIEKTKDAEAIKAAYRAKLPHVNPEDDEEGFKELRRAYEEALEYASRDEEEEQTEETEIFKGKKNEVDLWIERAEVLYDNMETRRDVSKWQSLLNDSVCDDLDTELEAAEKLLVFFMSHSYLPQNVWQTVDKRFHYMENMSQLKERFPENYLDFVRWQIESPGFIDYDLFGGQLECQADDYINKLYELKNVAETEDLSKVSQLLAELKRFDITHPFTEVEEARYLIRKSVEDESLKEKALSIMEELDFEYSDNPYIERIYAEILIENGQIDKASQVYDALVERSSENYSALLGQANCMFLSGEPEEAKERVEDILEERVQDVECLELLDVINEHLVREYTRKLEDGKDTEILYKLGWCYYQQKEFEKGIALLDEVDDTESYDYVNLRCRLYLANENYDLAYPLAKRWLAMIEECEDDGSREMTKRKNRLSLAHFSVGVCMWEVDYINAEEQSEEKERALEQGTEYINMAVREEHNVLVRLSYKEQLARFYLEAKQYEKCIEICDEIVGQDSGFFPAYVHRQRANYELKHAKEVIDDYFACQELYPVFVPPYLLAAEVFYAFDQYDDVEKVLEAAGEVEIESDTLELYRIRCIHYKEFSSENVAKALQLAKDLKDKIENAGKGESDLEDPIELERELAILYWDMDNVAMTLTIIEECLREHPDNSMMLHLKVDVLNREERSEEALAVCKELVKLEPENLYTKLMLGNCYERMQKALKAIDVYQDILKIDPEYSQAVRRLMYIYSYLSNRERDLDKCRIGIRYATRFIEITGTAEGYVERGNLYIDIYELEKSVEDCKKAIELDSEAYYAYNNLGCALVKLRRADEAIEPLLAAIKLDEEKDALPYLNLAECYTLKGEYEKAIDVYEKIIRLWPRRIGLLEDIAKLHRKLSQFEEAIACYKRIPDEFRKTFDDNKKTDSYYGNIIECYCDMGDTYAQMNDRRKAERCYKKAMSILTNRYNGNSFPDKIEDVIEFYRDCGDLKKAKKYANRLLFIAARRSYNNRQIVFAYATVLFESGDKKHSEKYAKSYLKELFEQKGGENGILADKRYIPMYSYNIAMMYICMGELEKACKFLSNIPDCKLCVMCETNECFEYHFAMGLVAELQGRIAEAKIFYEKAIEIRGYYPIASYHLERLKK